MGASTKLQQLVIERGFEREWTDFEMVTEAFTKGFVGVLHKGQINNVTVVAKTVRENPRLGQFEMALAELEILVTLGKHGNKHVVELIGACTEFWQANRSYIFLEFCPLGDLESFLASHREFNEEAVGTEDLVLEYVNYPESTWSFLQVKSTKPHWKVPGTSTRISGRDLFVWSSQIAKGMKFLQEKNIIRGNLQARNVLLKSLHLIKITDFSLAQVQEQKQLSKTLKAYLLPWRHMSFESLCQQSPVLNFESEVWSFGVTCWEIFSLACIPYGCTDWNRQLMQRLENGERLPRLWAASKQVYFLLQQCWNKNPYQRPCFDQIRTFFEKQLKLEGDLELIEQ